MLGLAQRGTTGSDHGFIEDASRVATTRGDLAFLFVYFGTPPQFLIRKLFVLAPVSFSGHQMFHTMPRMLRRPPFLVTNAENTIDDALTCFLT